MRIDQGIILILALSLASCGNDHDPSKIVDVTDEVNADPTSAEISSDAFTFDIIQRTCALYVAVRSGTFKSPASFDREIDASMVRWNMCDSGTMVACAAVPAANGDTIKVGIPWPYDAGAHF